MFHRYENSKLAAIPRTEKISAYCQICTVFAKGGQHFFFFATLCHILNSVILSPDDVLLRFRKTSYLFLSFLAATALSNYTKQCAQ